MHQKKNKRVRLEKTCQEVFGSPSGKILLNHLLEYCWVFNRGIFTGDNETYFNLGRRDVGLYLLELLRFNGYSSAQSAITYTKRLEKEYED